MYVMPVFIVLESCSEYLKSRSATHQLAENSEWKTSSIVFLFIPP